MVTTAGGDGPRACRRDTLMIYNQPAKPSRTLVDQWANYWLSGKLSGAKDTPQRLRAAQDMQRTFNYLNA
jgi:hypothetical protein